MGAGENVFARPKARPEKDKNSNRASGETSAVVFASGMWETEFLASETSTVTQISCMYPFIDLLKSLTGRSVCLR